MTRGPGQPSFILAAFHRHLDSLLAPEQRPLLLLERQRQVDPGEVLRPGGDRLRKLRDHLLGGRRRVGREGRHQGGWSPMK